MVDEEFKRKLEGKSYAGYNNILTKGRETIKDLYKKERKETSKKEKKSSKGKILKKPSIKLIQGLNSEKAIMQGTGNLSLVREIEKREYSPDHRSLYFKDEFIKEKERNNKWLS